MALGVIILIATTLLAYHNSFSGVFLLDDRAAILDNPQIRRLWPIMNVIVGSLRPLTDITFAINYALGGLSVTGYHIVNLTIHLLASLTLYGIVRRTLISERLEKRYGANARGIALSIALIWAIHPLQTQSVTYIVQRAESLMGLGYLLSLYCMIRATHNSHHRIWYGLSVTSCFLGMACKPVMVTTPLMLLIYDRLFIALSWRKALQRRLLFYCGLAASWILLALLLTQLTISPNPTAGFELENLSPLTYMLTQPGVVFHYLKLSIWPDPLILHYNWPTALSIQSTVLPAIFLIILFYMTFAAFLRGKPVAFLGAWFFVILAPSSSFIPITDVIFEHRMYLPLAAIVACGVFAGNSLLHLLISSKKMREKAGAALLILTATVLGTLTYQRNKDYQSAVAMWSATVDAAPHNGRAHYDLGAAYAKENRFDEAMSHFNKALELKPNYAQVYNNIGALFFRTGNIESAQSNYEKALSIQPDYAMAHNNIGVLLEKKGKLEEAIKHYMAAIEAEPTYTSAYVNMADALLMQGKLEEAIAYYEHSLWLKPELTRAHNNLGAALIKQGNYEAAETQFLTALHYDPDYTDARENLNNIHLKSSNRHIQTIQIIAVEEDQSP